MSNRAELLRQVQELLEKRKYPYGFTVMVRRETETLYSFEGKVYTKDGLKLIPCKRLSVLTKRIVFLDGTSEIRGYFWGCEMPKAVG